MEVYGLVGKSGTGKSYQALGLCQERGIPCLIDDGLFIGQNQIYAGQSAKRAETKMGAVKTAIFTEEEHRDSVMEAIRKVDPSAILILGTSDRMIYRIAARLELPEPKELIRIEDIADPEDIFQARLNRVKSGKHAIPVPTFQLKREFSGYFLKPMRTLRRIGGMIGDDPEKSEVRPTFSNLGEYSISERAVYDIIRCALREDRIVKKILETDIHRSEGGMVLFVSVILPYGVRIRSCAEEIQKILRDEVEEYTGFHITGVNITVKGLA
ncbi:MAG: Asp23/Gls24 family envelope stress response protein [Firmicutes bacterium]|nr:Asp23/Gls24 family envelope stress response protein [Bacillota bacterium]